MSGEKKHVRDCLFETLDTTSRLVEGEKENGTEGRPDFVLTDTVGFIKKLPTQLIESFASTLEAARDADVVVICADASSETLDEELKTVGETLEGVGIDSSEAIVCLNKQDLLSEYEREVVKARFPMAVTISAADDVGPLQKEVYKTLRSFRQTVKLFIPHGEYSSAAKLYGVAEIHHTTPTNEGTIMEVTLPEELAGTYSRYRIAS
jgi:GTP-binding protein HflX